MVLSLRTRIAVSVVLLIAVVVIVTLGVAYHEMVEAMTFAVDQIVLRDADVVRAELQEETEGPSAQAQRLAEVRYSLGAGGRLRCPLYRIWIDGEAEDLLASDALNERRREALAEVPLPTGGRKRKHFIKTISAGGRQYRALAMVVAVPDSARVVNAVVASPCDYALEEMAEFKTFMIVLALAAIGIGGGLAALLVHGATRPVGALADGLRKITHEDLSHPWIDDASIPSDLRPFAESVGVMLDRLNDAFEQQKRFTADAAHELRSPLAVAKSTIQATMAMPEDQRDYADMARSELDDLRRMERLIEELLLLARLEDGADGGGEPIEIPALVLEAVGLFDGGAGGDPAVVEPIPHAVVLGRREHLVRVLCNLLDNAFRHGPAGGPVRVSAALAGEGRVRITVHDKGGGVPPEAIEHLTERFYRVDRSRSRATGGSGLGLAIVAEIVRRHGGRFEMVSSPDSGTAAHVILPTVQP